MTPPPDTAVLIDGHALAFRSYFALPPLTSKSGEPTHAILGFMRQITRLMRQKSNQVIVVFDPPVKTFRHEQYEDYKAGRAEIPADLPAQINRIRAIVDAIGLPRLEVGGYEADDVIGTLAKKAEAHGMNAVIVTSDRDSYQLLTERVKVLTSDFKLFGPKDVLEKYGVSVEQWVDYRSLTGDASDNIPGAKGIGPKTAAKLLQEHGSLDEVIARAQDGSLEPKGTREKILSSLENVYKSRDLSCMVTDLPLEIEMATHVGAGDPAALDALLSELDLGSVRKDLGALRGPSGVAAEPEPEPESLAREVPNGEWRTPVAGVMWGYVLSREDDLTAELLGAATADGEITRTAPLEFEPVEEEAPEATSPPEEALFEEAASGKKTKSKAKVKPKPEPLGHVDESQFVGQREVNAAGAKALATHLQVRGLKVEPGDDPLLLAYLLDPNNTAMPAVAQRYLHAPWPSDAASRAALSSQLWDLLLPQLDEARLKLYHDIEKPLARVLARMEVRGVKLDSAYLRGLSESMGARIQTLEAEIHQHAGRVFSVSSRDQLEAVLYDELQLSTGRKTKLTGKRSTAVAALEPLIDEHPIIPALLEYRELSKLRGTYLDPLPNLVNPRTERLHTTFAQTIAATGRLSSLNPNLQNIPIRSAVGREIRKGFIADQGFTLLSADYSQIELRLLAHMSGDLLMQEAFNTGADIHRRTASQVLGVDENNVSADQRRAAKTVNFGVLYGMSAHRLSRDMNIPYADASGFIERYFETYPGIRGYIDRTLADGREKGYVETLYGRRRYVPELLSGNRNVREAGERLAYNMPIQGTAADIIKIAMIELDPLLMDLGARMLLQVHDELLVEAPIDKADEIAELIRSTMMNAAKLSVPLNVEVGRGPDWFDTK
ncbi:DNA polymerase I [Deinococcus psychrotolerans]|uniref:DNA polymerase I n=1 Tax=Deinococcus psychrotolerans TaxID=2489213 RepID=A0A3G8YE90_9DEIO|nr:DNA polymerase I [Deinococcus psychrotolerans]AZI43668.1 DNA polymerase I [Deinococcus psychrotolerans]